MGYVDGMWTRFGTAHGKIKWKILNIPGQSISLQLRYRRLCQAKCLAVKFCCLVKCSGRNREVNMCETRDQSHDYC